ncbi:hypothetical protein CVT26_004790 [Gymnopilus dilepis]|uniref:Tudor domain-containing protein n=1 Tax=Gymnopilus dilepis TaxID=231916 RepID=A0A409XZM2_9AGAR|nr:hypothetical protein CVT26_004790 [Gymnopilus dilepis]
MHQISALDDDHIYWGSVEVIDPNHAYYNMDGYIDKRTAITKHQGQYLYQVQFGGGRVAQLYHSQLKPTVAYQEAKAVKNPYKK